jgi:uncharacterized protein YlzI (FlbEa/FlbD family)
MIQLHRLNGQTIALNPDLIERVEETPDTVVTLIDDKKFLVAEALDDVIRLITDYRAYVIARSTDLTVVDEGRPTLHVVPNDVIVTTHGPGASAEDGSGGTRSEHDDDSDEGTDATIIDYFGDMEIS